LMGLCGLGTSRGVRSHCRGRTSYIGRLVVDHRDQTRRRRNLASASGDAVKQNDRPVTYWRRGLHGRIIDILGQRMINGDIPEGVQIEPEKLVTELDVSRTVVREAIKVLAAKGLLDSRPRLGTYVLPRQRWNLLDADVIRWR